MLVAVPVMAVFIGTVLVMVVPQFRSMQVKIDRINQVLREQITGVRVIRAFVRNELRGASASPTRTPTSPTTALRVNRIFALRCPR